MRRLLVPILVVTGAAGGYVLTDGLAASQVSTGVDGPQVDYPALAAEYDYTLAVAAEEARIQAEADAAAASQALRDQEAARIASRPPVGPQMAISVTAWPTSLQPCDGDLPPCSVKMRESGGDYNAKSPSSSASGAWQFLDSTWNGYGGYTRAMDAPPNVQDEKAREVWAGGAGCSHWSAC